MSTTSGKSLKDLGSLPPPAADKVKAEASQLRKTTAGEAAASGVLHPGVERWPVKTGTDADAAEVGVNNIKGESLGPGIVDTTVEDMMALPRAADIPPVDSSFPKGSFYQNHRTAPTETTVWGLKATVTGAELEQDRDYHLVLQGTSGKTMIGEIPDPDPAYVGNPVWLADIKAARQAMDTKLGHPLKPVDFKPSEMAPPTTERFANAQAKGGGLTAVNATATIIGVGFFDSKHGQDGVAPTAIEIHPILSIFFG